MRAYDVMVPAQTAVYFSGIQCRLQVIRNGDDREHDEDEHDQGKNLRPSVDARSRGEAQPPAEHQRGKKKPCEIEG